MKLAKNTVVHCSTEELANKVLKIAHDNGYKWWVGGSYVANNSWEIYKENTCYNIVNGEYCEKEYYLSTHYTIISAEQFLKDNKLKQEIMKDIKYFQTKTLRVNGTTRDITIAVYLKADKLYGGYAVRNPVDMEFNQKKARLIATGRAMNERTNLLKDESVGSLNHRYILKAIAENLLREIEIEHILIKGIR